MSTISNYIPDTIFDVVNKKYETRNAKEHAMLIDVLVDFFPTFTEKAIKLLTFYLETIKGPITMTAKQFGAQSFILSGLQGQNPEQITTMHSLSRDSKITLEQGQQIIYLSYQHYLNCTALGQSSIEQQINFMHNSEFMCSIPKKRLYFLIRNCKISVYSMSQSIYYEGQKIQPGESGSGVYFVRTGDFGYYKASEKQGKQIETLRFTKGHIIGTLEIGHGNQETYPQRVFTVKCKSSKSLIYNFPEQIFISHIKPYCEHYLNQRQAKLLKYLDNHVQKMSQTRATKTKFLSQSLTRRFSVGQNMSSSKNSDLPILARTKMAVPLQNYTTRTTHSQKLEEEGLRKTSYLSVVKQGPLNRYPLATQRSTFTQTQFKDFVRLQRSKDQCDNIKKLKGSTCTSNRGEILFDFFKKTWMFDKEKLRKKRYQ